MSVVVPKLPRSSKPSVLSHTGTVLKKNLLLKRRAWKATVLEVVLPSLFLLALIPAKLAAGDTKSDNILYAGDITDLQAAGAALKCKQNNEQDPRLAAVPACTNPMDPTQCLGNLCITLPQDNEVELAFLLSDFTDAKAAAPPDYDTVALLRWFALTTDLPGISDSGFYFGLTPGNSLNTGHHVAVVPPKAGGTDEQAQLAASFDAFLLAKHYTHQYTRAVYANEENAMAYAKSREGAQTLWAVVVIASQTEYTIRMNNTALPQTDVPLGSAEGEDLGGVTYVTSGFVTLQHDLTEWIAAAYNADAAGLLNSYIPMPVRAFSTNAFLASAGDFLPMVLAFAFLYPVTQMVTALVKEKETRIREGMLVMGLSSGAFKLSWFVTGFVQMTLTAVLMTIVFSVGFVPGTHGLLVFFVIWFYCLSLMAGSLLLSVFFSKAQLAAMLVPLVFLASVTPPILMANPSDGAKRAFSVVSSSAFAYAVQLVTKAESQSDPITFASAGEGGYTLQTAIFYLLFDSIAYLLLATYFDLVLPSEWGAKKPWYFIFYPPLWFASGSGEDHIDPDAVDGARNPQLLEAVEDPKMKQRARVVLTNLRKEFDEDGVKKVAVNNMNLTFYEGQVQVLLGHNGAGKTTLINMLTGMLPVTQGTATVYGRSVTTELGSVREDIGFCPQHNILWDNLTCAEHLRFFACLKGLPHDQVEDAVDEMLKRVDLCGSKDAFSADLSGGMKRKLSVAIALIGGSRFVIFDEPTAGMDVQARRCIWDLLKESRHGRTILLTTHFMDEADLLGDNIAIVHNGGLHCQGTGLFLKSRLGVGYNLKMDFDAAAHRPAHVTSLIEETVASAKGASCEKVELLSSAGTELAYRVPMWAVPRFSELFERLETDGPRLGVNSFGISVTTLEEVFLKIAHDMDEPAPAVKPPAKPTEAKPLSCNDATAPLYTAVALKEPTFAEAMALDRDELLSGTAYGASQFTGLLKKRFQYMRRDKCALCVQIVMPLFLVLLAIALIAIPVSDLPSLSLNAFSDPSLYPTNSQGRGADIASFTNYVPELVDAAGVSDLDMYLLQTFNDRPGSVEDRYVGGFVEADGVFQTFFNMTKLHSVAYASSVASAAQVRALGAGDVVVRAASHPFPFSDYYRDVISGFQAIAMGIFLLIPFTFIPGIYVSYVVREREIKAKHVQLVSGVRLGAYWGSMFAWDFAAFMCTFLMVLILLLATGKDEFVGDAEAFFAFFLVFVSYGLTAQACSYFVSFYFKSYTKAQNTVMLASFLSGFMLVITVAILGAIDSTKDVAKALSWIFRMVPTFCLGHALTELSALPTYRGMGLTSDTPLSPDATGYDIMCLFLMLPVYVVGLLLHEHPGFVSELLHSVGIVQKHSGNIVVPVPSEEDADVAAERRAVEVPGGRCHDVVTVQSLRKVYPPSGNVATPKVAVENVTFGVKSDEIFAFLGTNGAGKTTTLSVLSGELLPSAGQCYINGHDVVTEASMARRELGYCPQFDALLDLLTPREHLELYAALRGVPEAKRAGMIDCLIKVFDLTAHQHKRCKSLSGGNKRKTSVAVALIGNPSCVLLDEPTAGMDPVARRGLWTVLQKIGDGRCVVLTTHHLEEVEALAHRTAVMVAGSLRCMGTLTHLRSKFGGAYEIDVKPTARRLAATKTFFQQQFARAQLVEETNGRLTYTIALGDLTLSQMFRAVSNAKQELEISDFSINQTSLEQVFMAIARRSE